MAGWREEAFAAECDHLDTEPVDFDCLLRKLAHLVGSKQAGQ
jgi:hypothetical protein